jgi:hypothetical protein
MRTKKMNGGMMRTKKMGGGMMRTKYGKGGKTLTTAQNSSLTTETYHKCMCNFEAHLQTDL